MNEKREPLSKYLNMYWLTMTLASHEFEIYLMRSPSYGNEHIQAIKMQISISLVLILNFDINLFGYC